jgi:hypothetical protein
MQVELTYEQIPRRMKIHSFYLANLSPSSEIGTHWWLFWKNDIDTIQENLVKKYLKFCFAWLFCNIHYN